MVSCRPNARQVEPLNEPLNWGTCVMTSFNLWVMIKLLVVAVACLSSGASGLAAWQIATSINLYTSCNPDPTAAAIGCRIRRQYISELVTTYKVSHVLKMNLVPRQGLPWPSCHTHWLSLTRVERFRKCSGATANSSTALTTLAHEFHFCHLLLSLPTDSTHYSVFPNDLMLAAGGRSRILYW